MQAIHPLEGGSIIDEVRGMADITARAAPRGGPDPSEVEGTAPLC